MKKWLILYFALFFLSCGHTPSLVPESSESVNPSDELESQGLEISSLELNEDSFITVNVGDTRILYLNIFLSDGSLYKGITKRFNTSHDELDADVIWYSNDDHLATVTKSGKILGLAAGSTFIQASLGNKSAKISINVTEDDMAIISLAFHESQIQSNQSGQITLDVEYSDGSILTSISVEEFKMLADCNLSFSSANENVAVIYQNGNFSPVGNGATILNAACGDLRASMTVIVNDFLVSSGEIMDQIDSVSITMDQTEFEIGKEITLTCDLSFDTGDVLAVNQLFVLPQGGMGEVTWQSSDNGVVSIFEDSDQILKAGFKTYGSAILSASYSDTSDDWQLETKMLVENALDVHDYFIYSDDVLTDDFAPDGGYGYPSFPDIVYGMPQSSLLDVVSFGTEGKLTIKFNGYVIVDGPGDDFIVFENPFNSWTEAAIISVSDDGKSWFEFPCDALGSGLGCAGITAVNYSTDSAVITDPVRAGGDSFDLADVGLSRASYVKIVDKGTCVEDGYLCTADTIGFDLDAVALVNGENE